MRDNCQVLNAVTIEVCCYQLSWVSSGAIDVAGSKAAIAIVEKDAELIVLSICDCQIGEAIAIEVCACDSCWKRSRIIFSGC